jgi:SAM-dependent methyltransferase
VLCEAAPKLRETLAERYAGDAKIMVASPEQVADFRDQSIDLIVMHSVAQYLSAAELDRLLAMFHSLLKPGGLFVIGDIVPPHFAAPAAALSLLRFGAANGFFWAAAFGLMRIFVSDYLKLKKTVGLSHYTEAAMLGKLRKARYAPERAGHNIGHNQSRMTFLARPA